MLGLGQGWVWDGLGVCVVIVVVGGDGVDNSSDGDDVLGRGDCVGAGEV